MNPSDADELRALAEAYVAGELSAGQKVELENRLRTGEEARLCFLAFLEVHAGLAWEFRGGNAALREHPEAREMFRRACHVDAGLLTMAAKDAPVRRFWSDRWMPLAAAAAIVMVLGLSALWLMSSWGTVARVARAESTADMKPGDRLAIGRRIELSGGKVVIEFNCGAVATLTGPCVFEIESATQALLQRGHVHTLAARPEAKGFTIRTPRSRVVDLGTEFVTAVADDGHSRVDVNSGEVVVHLSGSDAGSRARRSAGDRAHRARRWHPGLPLSDDSAAVEHGLRRCVAGAGEGITGRWTVAGSQVQPGFRQRRNGPPSGRQGSRERRLSTRIGLF